MPTWRAAGAGTRVRLARLGGGAAALHSGHVGKLGVDLKDQRVKHGVIAFKAQATLPQVTPGATVRVTVVLGADPLGHSIAGKTGDCAAQVAACTADATLSRFACR